MIARWILAAAAAFLIGSIPWGLWIGRTFRGIDVRRHGSGNLGATNVYRVLGPAWGITVLLLDAGKGVAAVLLCRALLAGVSPALNSWAGMTGLVGSVLGHSFSPLAGWRGGKAVAAAGGAWGALLPAALACALGVFFFLFAFTRIVSASSIAASLALPVAVAILRRGGTPLLRDPVFWMAVLTALLILARHRANLERLRRGAEKPLDLRSPPAPSAGEEIR